VNATVSETLLQCRADGRDRPVTGEANHGIVCLIFPPEARYRDAVTHPGGNKNPSRPEPPNV
jgi:hypothetical protein